VIWIREYGRNSKEYVVELALSEVRINHWLIGILGMLFTWGIMQYYGYFTKGYTVLQMYGRLLLIFGLMSVLVYKGVLLIRAIAHPTLLRISTGEITLRSAVSCLGWHRYLDRIYACTQFKMTNINDEAECMKLRRHYNVANPWKVIIMGDNFQVCVIIDEKEVLQLEGVCIEDIEFNVK